MNKVLKKALGFASALVLMAVMVLAASPVQASDVDTRIQALERELAQLKQNQESALAAEMMVPTADEAAAAAKATAAADAAAKAAAAAEALAARAAARAAKGPPCAVLLVCSRRRPDHRGRGQQLEHPFHAEAAGLPQHMVEQRESRCWLPEPGNSHPAFRPTINVTSQQGFYAATWLLNNGDDGKTFGGDRYINFDMLNPWLPSFGWGASPGLDIDTQADAFRTDSSPLLDGLGMSGGQDGSFVR